MRHPATRPPSFLLRRPVMPLLLTEFKTATNSLLRGAGIACLQECRTRGRKVASSNPGRSGGRIFFFRVNFVCQLLFCVRSIPVLPQWHAKDPGHSAESAGGRLDLNTHTPLTQPSRCGLTMPLSRWEGSHAELVREHSATVVSAR